MSSRHVVVAWKSFWDVEYDYTPGKTGRQFMANGDPGYPDEPAEVEISRVYALGSHHDILECLSDKFVKVLENAIFTLEADTIGDID